ncbi:baseplate assembly protein [Chromobacterium haemolyticum]|uniref:baseplate assembly protein n=1 Tax=Chromobacterium haemolyticum TaxID=394935 RepID=UPI00244A8F68|nr:baseplate J/gp47 family protein [Chromobacterium haemolyticum]MDH0343607.1 baseplate J/gp47 family protein [Chromobacterium haemolyticum]
MTPDLPKFIDDDPHLVTAELIDAYQKMSGKTLYPGQVERLLIDLIAYRESVVRAAFNDAGRQNLVAFARAPMLDYLGELVGVSRLPAQHARCTVRIAFPQSLALAQVIPAQTLVAGGGVQFQTLASQIAPAGSTSIDLPVSATEAGAAGNGFVPGQINTLVDELEVDASVVNIDTSAGGADAEDDERLRARIRLAPESFSVAGSAASYRHHALRAHQDIADVAVISASLQQQNGELKSANQVPPGVVRLYPLTKTGMPPDSLLSVVAAACSADRVRPLTDLVEVLAPEDYGYRVRARLTPNRDVDPKTVQQQAQAAVGAFVQAQAERLGRDIVPSQLIATLSVPGVYQVTLLEPAATQVVPPQGWSHCTDIQLEMTGGQDG